MSAVEAFEIAECPDGLVEKKHGPSVLLCERPDGAFGTVGEDGVSTSAGNVLEKGEGGRRGVPFVVHDRKIAILQGGGGGERWMEKIVTREHIVVLPVS